MNNVLTGKPIQATETGLKPDKVIRGVGFDWMMIALSAWFLGGLFLDGWAHNHLAEALETFFTSWHAAFYSGFFAVAAFLTFTTIRNLTKGYRGWNAVPVGYEASLLAVVLFSVGGVADVIWHTWIGIEADVEALLSPPHLLLAFSMGVIISGPLRAAWRRNQPESQQSWTTLLPMLVSLTFTLSLLTFFTQFAHPFSEAWTMTDSLEHRAIPAAFAQELGVAAVLIYTILLMGAVLFMIRRWNVPLGSLTLIFTLNAIGMSLMQDHFLALPPAILSGLAADILLKQLRPSLKRLPALRAFAFCVPVIFYTSYFLFLLIAGQLIWSIHLWAGSAVMAGIAGWLLSYVWVAPETGEPAT